MTNQGKRIGAIDLLGAVLLVAALLSCKKDEAASGAASATPEPAKATSAAPATTPGPTAPAAAPAPAAAKPASYKLTEVPAIPTTKSNPPKGNEWDEGVVVNTQGAGTRATNCNMRILREWLRINCQGSDIVGTELQEDFGVEGSDFYSMVTPGKVASFVTRLKPGRNQKIRICKKGARASLFVSFPPGGDRPRHVALSRGPACDGSDWGTGYVTKKPAAAAAGAADDGLSIDDQYMKELMESQAAAAKDCSSGNQDACYYYCGAPSC